MAALPEEAHVGAQSCAGAACEHCFELLTSADEYTAGSGPKGEIACADCLPEAWRSHYLQLAAEAEQDEQDSALAAIDAEQAAREATASREAYKSLAARMRAAAAGLSLIQRQGFEQREQGAAE